MNAKQPTLVTPPYHPYLSVSKNGGLSFETPRYLDSVNYLAGSSIPQVMPSPVVSANGTFFAIYPSYETTQSIFPRYLLANSTSQGLSLNHTIVYQGLDFGAQNNLLKRGALLKADPSNAAHLAYFFLSEINDGADVYFTETTDAGITWTTMQRINQDPIANGKLQDLLWADFDVDGDLLVCWRDRRNGLGTSYAETTEIYAAVRPKDSLNFNLDYPISSQQIQHDSILESSGNDFMNTCLMNDTAYSIWGDVRSGSLKIYLHKWNILSQVSTISEIPTNEIIQLFPNPSNLLIQLPQHLIGETYAIFSSNGSCIVKKEVLDEFIDISELAKGGYTLQIQKDKFLYGVKFIKD